ncbi:MAG: dihydrofolate reductase family protein [Gammaproteobacteria bacterium]|nr:dihydrofolate reductase family protein [Gammaproteobacteria bacterium]
MTKIMRLYPPFEPEIELNGLYLSHAMQNTESDETFVFTNFISTLDGRISLPDPETGKHRVPPKAANPNDLRLFYELIARADVIVTTARHLRAVAKGHQPDLLNLDTEACNDLVSWRRQKGLTEQPAIAVISKDLDLPEKAKITHSDTPILVFSWRDVDEREEKRLRANGYELICCGEGEEIDGGQLVDLLQKNGYRNIYSIAGPRIFTALLNADRIDRLYLTLTHLMLGGENYNTITYGKGLEAPNGFTLRELYYDAEEPHDSGQMFAVFDRISRRD